MSQPESIENITNHYNHIYATANKSLAIISAVVSLNDAQHRGRVEYVPTPDQMDELYNQIADNLKDIKRAAAVWHGESKKVSA